VDFAWEVTALQHRYAVVAGLLLLLIPCAASLGQGLGYSIWEKSTGETEPVISWYGQTGLVLIPSALVGPAASVQGGAHWVNTDWVVGTAEEDLWLYSATVSLTDDLEVGAARLHHVPVVTGGAPQFDDATIMNAKYRVPLGSLADVANAPDIAFGIWDITNDLNRGYYVVASKALHTRDVGGPADLTVTAGLGNNEADEGTMDGFFAGVEIAPAPMFRLQAEYDAENFNAALRFFPTTSLSLDFATIDGDLGVGASFRFGF